MNTTNTPNQPTGIENDAPQKRGSAAHWKLTQIEFKDQTDVHNELVHEREWLLHPVEKLALKGNLFLLEDTLTREGSIYLKRAPLPHARPVPEEVDLSWKDGKIELHGGAYETAILPYSGGRFGAMAAVQKYQREVRPFVPGRDGLFLSNTWGDRSRDARVNEEFMLREIEAGARLGVEVIQIDDGWQLGRTANSAQKGGVWIGFWEANENFWDVHPERFPSGLQPLIVEARRHGVQFGLWFAPDSADDFANWQRDVAAVLKLHRDLGVNYFKIDGVKATTQKAEINLRRFFTEVLNESNHRIVFDLDVTAEIRPGYWGSMETGPLFVENRYTDWHRYWPHFTLRNLWKLAQWVDATRLRFEFLNHERNGHLYENDPLAPTTYTPDYLFATVMFSNPLGWFEVSNLPQSYFQKAAPLIEKWKAHRDAIFSGTIYSIGAAPDGTSWTGFISLSPDEKSGYALIFRELNDASSHSFTLPFAGEYQVEILAGQGSIALKDNLLQATLTTVQYYLFARFYV
jgi:alpha-galactosidase